MRKSLLSFIFLLILIVSGKVYAQGWHDMKTVEDVCIAYPEEMKKMLGEFDLNRPGMEQVKEAFASKNISAACTLLLEYYQNSIHAQHLREKNMPAHSEKTEAEADSILNNIFVIQNVRGVVPWGEDGHRDWHYRGPNNDREWAWLSNRHSQLNHVFDVYLETGNPKYAIYVDEFLRDFIIKSMPYPGVKGSDAVWRGLEVSFRSKVWSRIFYGLLQSEYLQPSTRLLMLSSLPDHAHYNRHFHSGNNWLTMEISALATVATNFPEYNDAEEWLNYSIDTMAESMKNQVYPDGAQTELTSHYHNVSLSNFDLFKEICDRAGKPLPPFFNRTLEAMYAYIAHAVRPDGNRILNNDGDLGSDRSLILKGAHTYDKPDWEYIVTNGKSGINPTEDPSYLFPWAGQLISRSGFDADAHWSFFDIGPWGSGHQHNDKLNISVSAYGRDLLVDAGRFAYTGEVADKFRSYARGSQGHNVLLFDHKGQGAGPLLAEQPLSEEQWEMTDAYDYAKGSFDIFPGLEGKLKHTRHLYYSRGDFWIVV
ncbi:MAG: heparinase, partial [Bacteroidetes bacterium GWC1_47_7]